MDDANKSQSFSEQQNNSTQFEGLGKLPPQEPEMEAAVLGALMLEKDALTDVVDVLKPESFYIEKHQVIYNAIMMLFQMSEPIDILTVTNHLKRTGDLQKAGGAFYISQLTSKVNSAANIEYHSRIVSEMSIKRSLISISSEMQKDAYEQTSDVFELLDKTEQALFHVSDSNVRKSYSDMQSTLREALQEIEDRKDNSDGLTGVPSGLTQLDRVTNGWQPSDLVIIAARPAMGKTAFVLTCLRNASVDFGKPVVIFSLEMSAVQLITRIISSEAEIASDKLRKGDLEEYEWKQLHEKITDLSEAKLFVDDTPGLSILELRAKCRRLKQQHDIQMIVIDYLQLMSGDTASRKAGNREQEIASISRSLKHIAKELEVPVIALSQLSRAVESRGDKRPQLSDLRESGSIEQDADQVMFLFRPEYYGITETDEGMPTAGMGEVIIAKNRHGSLEDVPLKFIGQFTKFCDMDQLGAGNTFEASSSVNSFPEATGGATDGPMVPGGNTKIMSSKINTPNDDFSGTGEEVPF
ncbi:replicative DNA helicase [Cyclobacteriaceae bacterium]|nr:replicative DNA helicase [Cyclobacteriaceae bacterium]